MSNLPADNSKNEIQSEDKIHPDLMQLFPVSNPFLSFRYSSRSIESEGTRAHVKSREVRLKNGRIETEELEGTIGAQVYGNMMKEVNRAISNQMELFFKPFSGFLNSGNSNRRS